MRSRADTVTVCVSHTVSVAVYVTISASGEVSITVSVTASMQFKASILPELYPFKKTQGPYTGKMSKLRDRILIFSYNYCNLIRKCWYLINRCL